MGLPALRPLSNLEILDGAFTLYRRNFVALVGVALLFTAPVLALQVVKSVNLATIVNSFASFAMIAALVRIAADATLGQPTSIGRSMQVGLRKTVPLLINFFIFGILIFIGLLALIVGAFLVGIMGFAIAQVVVIENRWDGFARSRMLAKQSWGKISILMLLSWIITFLPQSVLIGGVAFAMFQSESDPRAIVAGAPLWIVIAGLLLQCLTAPFSQCVLTLLYFDQRVRKEGLGIEMQAAALPKAG